MLHLGREAVADSLPVVARSLLVDDLLIALSAERGYAGVSLLDQGGPPAAARAPAATGVVAPCLRHRSGDPPPLSAHHRRGRLLDQKVT
ncbi:hypothetical protein OHB41_42760 [Streptomyces sp. NBC_01571]|uniref:hypothetical protein n=1 Tax=Streptomyces sp. NBC_01571 TaxID=2975883 RepID=UPI0022575D8C|nr:hypothetical protein [Streptomyces sp. NBC_01571]MCX4579790.1 hypothetical protein [Streptomyces sp. NBC_01571]